MEKKKLRSFWEKLLIGILCYFLAAGGLYWVVKEDWHASDAAVLPVLSEHLADGLCADKTLHQTFKIHMDDLSAISVSGVGDAASVLRLQLYDGADLLWETSASGDCLHPGEQTRFEIEPALTNMRGKTVTLVAQTDAGSVSLWYGNAMSAGKFDVKVEALGELTIGNQPVEGSLALGQFGRDVMGADAFFWPVALMLGAMILCVAYWEHQQGIKGKRTLYAMLSGVIRQYRFLVKQLVSRDFKVKYKASALGVFWSFLNPLLTMTVYMVVFSTVFTSNIEHFPAYLISGIVLFNFFSESSSLGLRAMVDNAALIKKIYIPK